MWIKEYLRKPFDKLRASGHSWIPFVVSLSNQKRNPATQNFLKHCRVCRGSFFPEPRQTYQNMPASAQGFPVLETLSDDHGMNFSVFQCADCGLVQLDAAPVPYYREVIRAAAYSPEMRAFRLTQFSDWRDRYRLKGKRILEIGCGRGEYLSLLKESELLPWGLEAASESVAACHAAGLPASRGYLGEPLPEALGHDRFDGFVCLNFMEHWPDPTASLRHLHTVLTDDACGLIEVPNLDMILKEGLFSEFISDHLLYFTEETLRNTLSHSGFEIQNIQAVWHDYILSAEVRRRQPADLSTLKTRQQTLTEALQTFARQYPQVAIWGAGHQALSVIALANLAPHIAYVVDSAPFKQGRYTPASHLPIVSPDHLQQHPPDAVLVMAASYSDEVCRQLKSRALPVKIAVLRHDTLECLP